MKHYFTRTKNVVVTALAVTFLGISLSAQLAMTRSSFTGAYTPISTAGGATVSTAAGDDGSQVNIPLGFTFNYLGTPYTSVQLCTNGWLSFSNTASGSFTNSEMYSNVGPNNAVFPWFDDLTLGVNSVVGAPSLIYQTQGAPGSQTFTAQWTNVCAYRTTGGSALNFQVILYEGTNVVEFRYGTKTVGTYLSGQSASIGIENSTGGNLNYMDAMTGSSTTGQYYLSESQWPAYHFRFTPGVPTVLAGGTYNVGIGQTYGNLTEAVCDIQQRGISGAVTLNLVDAVYDTTAAGGNNFFPIIIGPVAGNSSVNTITISKASGTAAIRWGGNHGSSTNGSMVNQASTAVNSSNVEPIFALVGADYVTVNNVDIRGNVGFQNADHAIGIYNSSATDGATNNMFTNFTTIMRRANTGTRAVVMSVVTTPSAASGANSNNTFRNFSVSNTYAGIQLSGNSTFPDLNTVITNTTCTSFNAIGDPATANDIGNGGSQTFGIRLTNQSGFTVSNCSIRNVTGSAIQTDGILVETFQGTCTLRNNKIQTIRNSSTSSTTNIAGMRLSHTTTGTHVLRVYNNTVSEITSAYTGTASATRTLKGIFVSGTGGATTQSYEIYDNSVSIDGSASLNLSSVCFEIATTSGPVMMIGNNIFSNTTATQTGVARHYGMFSTSATLIGNTGSVSNNNDIYVPNDNGTSGFAVLGNATTYATVPAWNTASTLDAASVSINPVFASAPSNLHATALTLNGLGMLPPAYITADLDCAARTPDNDLGAYIINGCNGTPTAGAITGSTTVCTGTGTTLTLSGASTDAGVVYQWASSPTPGGPYTTLLGNSTTQATGNLAATTYYVVVVGCTVSSQSVTTTEFTVTVVGPPAIAVTPTSGVYCQGGPGLSLTASGASVSYSWGPAAGLSATTGATVTATPTIATTYTVTGTSVSGCTASTTVLVNYGVTPTVSVTATPPTVCNGGNSQLQATASIPAGTYNVTSIPYTPIAGTGTQAVTGDDAVSGAIALPFSFTFYGTPYAQVFVYTNGFIQFGTSSGSTTTYGALMPTAGTPNTIIGGVWSDMNATAGQITTYVTGVAPNRVFTVYYNNVQFYDFNFTPTVSGNTNYQIQLFETSNIVEVHIGSVTGQSTTTANKTLGIENQAGTASATPPGRNFVNWTVSTPEAWRFAPNTGAFTYGWTPPTFLSSTTISNPMANNITSTISYSVVATELSGCTSTGTVTITSGTALTSSGSITPASTVCAGTNVTLNSVPVGGGAPYTYAWTGPNSFTSTVQNPVLNATTVANSGTYTLIITDACGATNTVSLTLTVNALPVVAVTPTSATFCSGGPGVALAATGATTYAWGPAAGLSATTGSNVSASPAATTSYTVTGTNSNGCVATASTTITFASGVVGATATAAPAAVCAGSSVTLTSTSNGIPTVLMTENFNAGAPTWIRTNTSTGGTPANAAWTDRPDGFVYAAGTPYHSNDNTQFVQTNSDAQGLGSTTRTTLQSPVFSTTGVNTVTVNFYQYYRDINDNGDSAVVEASLDGINWTIITAYTANSGVENAFSNQTVTLPGAYDNQPTVYVRFRFVATWDWYWSIDNVTIGGNSSAGITFAWASSPAGFTAATQNTSDVPTVSTMYTVTMTTAAGCTATASTSTVTINALPTVTASTTASAVCAGNAVTFNGGGAASYTWTGGVTDNVPFTPTVTDTYTVTGTGANGCTNTAIASVTVNALPTVTASSTASAVCAGDQVTFNGGGATAYVWTGSVTDNVPFTPTVTDTYTVTGTDGNGCTNTASVMVTVNALPTVTASSTASAVCDGSPVTFNGGGATSYTWTGSVTDNVPFTPTVTDTYTVTGTDGNGCTNTASVMVTVNALPTVTASASASAICSGDSVDVNGGGASSYTWTGGVMDGVSFAPSATDTYTVTGTDGNGCTNTASVMITVNATPVVTLSLPLDTICTNFGSVMLSGETPAGGMWSGPGVSGNMIDPVMAGVGVHTITYMYMDSATGCSATAIDMVTVDVCNGVDEIETGAAVVFPNPNNGDFTLIPAGTGVVDVTIYSATGQLVVAQQMACGQQNKISIAASGMYSVVIVTADGHRTTQRVIVNR